MKIDSNCDMGVSFWHNQLGSDFYLHGDHLYAVETAFNVRKLL